MLHLRPSRGAALDDRILIVDDDAAIVGALRRICESEGWRVSAFVDPRDAVRAMDEEGPFPVVVSDYMMSHLNGAEVLEAARKAYPEGARLLLTAANDFRAAMDAVNRGHVMRIVPKPWGHGDLVATLRSAFEAVRLRRENRELTAIVQAQNVELRELNVNLEQLVIERTNNLLDGMIAALDFRDAETQWHSRRVSRFTRHLAELLGIEGASLLSIEQGALLHDVGKIAVRDAILLKPGRLTPEEWDEMRTHPEAGWQMLRRIPYLREASLVVLQHHERWDGKGYPSGLRGEEIHIGARAFSVADSYDAITSDRPYRRAEPHDVALSELQRVAGTQLDPHLVEVFCSVPESDWRRIREQVTAEADAEVSAGIANTVRRAI